LDSGAVSRVLSCSKRCDLVYTSSRFVRTGKKEWGAVGLSNEAEAAIFLWV
jgi:hypothetical protein